MSASLWSKMAYVKLQLLVLTVLPFASVNGLLWPHHKQYLPAPNATEVVYAMRRINAYLDYKGHWPRSLVRVVSGYYTRFLGSKSFDLVLEIEGSQYGDELCKALMWFPLGMRLGKVHCWVKETDPQKIDFNSLEAQKYLVPTLRHINRGDYNWILGDTDARINLPHYFTAADVAAITTQNTKKGRVVVLYQLQLGRSVCTRDEGFASENIMKDCPVSEGRYLSWRHDVVVLEPYINGDGPPKYVVEIFY